MRSFTILFLTTITATSAFAEFIPVNLLTWPNWNNYFVGLPTGSSSFDSVPFLLRSSDPAFIVTADGLPSAPADVDIPASIPGVVAVHLLMNGGNMYINQLGDLIGNLQFVGSGSTYQVDLIAGQNIREWSPYNPGAVINTLTDPNAREVWSGTWSGWITAPARIDLYTVYLPGTLGSLESIQIHDVHGRASVNCYGITAQVIPEPTTYITLGLGALVFIKKRRKS